MEKRLTCPACGLQVSENDRRCLYCGRELHPPGTESSFRREFGELQRETNRPYFIWVFLGVCSSLVVFILGSLFILRPLAAKYQVAGDPGGVTLVFALVGCLLGILLIPFFSIIGARMTLSINSSNKSSMIGAMLGGSIYALLSLGFAIINILLSD